MKEYEVTVRFTNCTYPYATKKITRNYKGISEDDVRRKAEIDFYRNSEILNIKEK